MRLFLCGLALLASTFIAGAASIVTTNEAWFGSTNDLTWTFTPTPEPGKTFAEGTAKRATTTNGVLETSVAKGRYTVSPNNGSGSFIAWIPDGSGTYDLRNLYKDANGGIVSGDSPWLPTTGGPVTGNLRFSGALSGGVIPPYLTQAQIAGLTTVSNGMIVFNITSNKVQLRIAGVWQDIPGEGGGGGTATNAIAQDGGTGTDTLLIDPTIRGLTSQQLTNRALFINAGDSESALYYASGSTATMSPLNWPAWLPSMGTYQGKFDLITMAIPGQSLVTISNNLESVYVPLALSATNRVRYFTIQGGYNDKSAGATDAQVSNTVYGISQRMRAVGCKTIVFDIVGYKTAANSISNLVLNGGADFFVPFDGAESYLMADNIHLMPQGSQLWARSLTNVVRLEASPELARINDDWNTNETAKIPTLGFSYNSAYWVPDLDGTTNTRPRIEWHRDGIMAISTDIRRFLGNDLYFGKSFGSPAAYHGMVRGGEGSPLAINLPGTNQIGYRLGLTDSLFFVAGSGGLVGNGNVGFGVNGVGNSFFKGQPTFYDQSIWTDYASNTVSRFGRAVSGFSDIGDSVASWGFRITGLTNNWFVAGHHGTNGLAVDGETGATTVTGGFSLPAIPTNSPTAVAALHIAADGTVVKGPISSGGGGSGTFSVPPTLPLPMDTLPRITNGGDYLSWPVSVRDLNGDFVTVVATAKRHTVTNRVFLMTKSTDQGASWGAFSIIASNNNVDQWVPTFGISSSGRYHVLTTRYPSSGPYVGLRTQSKYSDDGGATWSTPADIPFSAPGAGGWTETNMAFGRIVEQSGRLFAGMFNWNPQGRTNGQSWMYYSDNDGVSWTTNFIRGWTGHTTLEPVIVPVGGSNLLCFTRVLQMNERWKGNLYPFFISKSTNNGATWQDVGYFSLGRNEYWSNPAGIHQYTDGTGGQRLLLAYGNRATRYGEMRDVSVIDLLSNTNALANAQVYPLPEICLGEGDGGYFSPFGSTNGAEVWFSYYYTTNENQVLPIQGELRFGRFTRGNSPEGYRVMHDTTNAPAYEALLGGFKEVYFKGAPKDAPTEQLRLMNVSSASGRAFNALVGSGTNVLSALMLRQVIATDSDSGTAPLIRFDASATPGTNLANDAKMDSLSAISIRPLFAWSNGDNTKMMLDAVSNLWLHGGIILTNAGGAVQITAVTNSVAPNGSLFLDRANSKLWFRAGGAWTDITSGGSGVTSVTLTETNGTSSAGIVGSTLFLNIQTNAPGGGSGGTTISFYRPLANQDITSTNGTIISGISNITIAAGTTYRLQGTVKMLGSTTNGWIMGATTDGTNIVNLRTFAQRTNRNDFVEHFISTESSFGCVNDFTSASARTVSFGQTLNITTLVIDGLVTGGSTNSTFSLGVAPMSASNTVTIRAAGTYLSVTPVP